MANVNYTYIQLHNDNAGVGDVIAFLNSLQRIAKENGTTYKVDQDRTQAALGSIALETYWDYDLYDELLELAEIHPDIRFGSSFLPETYGYAVEYIYVYVNGKITSSKCRPCYTWKKTGLDFKAIKKMGIDSDEREMIMTLYKDEISEAQEKAEDIFRDKLDTPQESGLFGWEINWDWNISTWELSTDNFTFHIIHKGEFCAIDKVKLLQPYVKNENGKQTIDKKAIQLPVIQESPLIK